MILSIAWRSTFLSVVFLWVDSERLEIVKEFCFSRFDSSKLLNSPLQHIIATKHDNLNVNLAQAFIRRRVAMITISIHKT